MLPRQPGRCLNYTSIFLLSPRSGAQRSGTTNDARSFPRPNHQREVIHLLNLRAFASQISTGFIPTHHSRQIMPSKHTVVVSLDDKTVQIVDDLGGNRSKWIREAILWRHTSDVEVLQALADARGRRIQHLLKAIRTTYQMADQGLLGSYINQTAINHLKECDY